MDRQQQRWRSPWYSHRVTPLRGGRSTHHSHAITAMPSQPFIITRVLPPSPVCRRVPLCASVCRRRHWCGGSGGSKRMERQQPAGSQPSTQAAHTDHTRTTHHGTGQHDTAHIAQQRMAAHGSTWQQKMAQHTWHSHGWDSTISPSVLWPPLIAPPPPPLPPSAGTGVALLAARRVEASLHHTRPEVGHPRPSPTVQRQGKLGAG